ncbi:hypothetical protein TURU_141189 [Turdus rufiventris]|nr:hypothetical protein TURU_141189 [Turdus rufiventris]
MCNCLPSLVASLPGIIIICGLTALFCIVLFDTTPARGQKKTVKKLTEPGKIERDIHNITTNPEAPQEAIEFDIDDLLVKVEKISPDHNVCPQIFPKEQFVPGSKVWQVQLMADAQEETSSDEQSYVLTFQSLQNTLRIFLEIISGTSQKRGDVRSTTISKNRKSK